MDRLQRDSTLERLVDADIDLAHAARAEAMQASIMGNLRIEPRAPLGAPCSVLEDFETRRETSARARSLVARRQAGWPGVSIA